MKKSFLLSSCFCFYFISHLNHGSDLVQKAEEDEHRADMAAAASPSFKDSDLKQLELIITEYNEINRQFQEATRPPEHGTTVDKIAVYQMRMLSLGAMYGLSLDNSISNVNERFRDLGRRVNEQQQIIKQTKRDIEKILSKNKK